MLPKGQTNKVASFGNALLANFSSCKLACQGEQIAGVQIAGVLPGPLECQLEMLAEWQSNYGVYL
jgi:hypothetical protein